MKGDERVRFCELCSLHVYNIAELTASEAKSLVANAEGRICARLFRRSDGTVITKDCPVGLRAIRRRVGRITGAAFATLIGLCGGAFGQKAKDDQACRQQVTITQNRSDKGAVEGTILDPSGAVLPGTKVTLVELASRQTRDVATDAQGRFRFSGVAPGVYELLIVAADFKSLVVPDVKVTDTTAPNIDAIVMVGVNPIGILELPMSKIIDTTKPGTTIITERMIRSLPIP